jgi:hypothetical protein
MRTCPNCYAQINDITEQCPACNTPIPEGYVGNVAPPPVHLPAKELSFGSDALARATYEEPRHTWIWFGNLISILLGIFLVVTGLRIHAIVYLGVILMALSVLSLIVSRFGARWDDLSFGSKALIAPSAALGALLYLWPIKRELEHPRPNRRLLMDDLFLKDAKPSSQKERTQ